MAITIAQAVKKVLTREPFYGLFLMGLDKSFDKTIPTAGVRRNGINIELIINEDYWNSLDNELCISVLLHETMHIIYKHLWMREDFPDATRFNISADCHVNSYIPKIGEDWYHPSQYELGLGKGIKYYYENLPRGIENDYTPFDDHDWKDFRGLSEAEKQLIDNQIDYQAKTAAEQVMKMQGRIPGNLTEYFDKLFKKKERIFNWRSYFRRMIGTIQDIELKKTRKKESIRFPDASGLKHKKKSNICVVVDTSGSVSETELVDFFNEIYYVWKTGADVTIIENDAAIGRIYQYKGKFDGKVTGRGGTQFEEAVEWFNDHRREFNTVIFFTDGYADVDLNIMGPNIWVITSNGNHQQYPGRTLYIPK